MPDNTIQLKVSVDTSDLDKLEEQLTRIKQLMLLIEHCVVRSKGEKSRL